MKPSMRTHEGRVVLVVGAIGRIKDSGVGRE